MADLINSLLFLAKANKEEMSKKFKKIRIDQIIFDSYEQVQKINSKFNLDFNIQISDEIENPMEVLASKSLLKIAFINLLKNASLYSSNNKASVLIAQTEREQITVTIKNEGKAITSAELNNIFEPFTRGVNASQIQGSGLGLPIVKRILDYHNADISYVSAATNSNEFIITFSN